MATTHRRPPIADAGRTVQSVGYETAACIASHALELVRRRGGLSVTPEAIMRAAEQRTGLPDREPDEIAEPLDRLCHDIKQHPPTALGAAIIRSSLVQAMASRRRLQQQLSAVPLRTRRPPIVLVGWYRTGTTFLQQLLGALPGYGFVPMHRLMEPVRCPGSRWRAALGARLMSTIAPELPIVHPVSADGPEECWQVLTTHLVVDGFAFHWRVPSFEEWLQRANRRPAYRAWARTAALLERDLGHGLVLKDPAHMMALPEMLACMPNARVVWTHRDPATCIASYGSVTAIQHRSVYGRLQPRRAGRVCLDRMQRSISAGMAARSAVPRRQLVDVPYPELVRAPVTCVERICAELDLPFDRRAVEQRVRQMSKPRQKHRYSLAQWGLTPSEVQQRLKSYAPAWWRGA